MSDFHNKAINDTLTYDERRALAVDYLPASVNAGSLSVIGNSNSSVFSTSLLNNSTLNMSFTNTFSSTESVLAIIDVAITSDGIVVPSASAGVWKLFGPVYCSYSLDGTAKEDNQQMARLSLMNLTGSTHTVVVWSLWRSIINKGGVTEGDAS